MTSYIVNFTPDGRISEKVMVHPLMENMKEFEKKKRYFVNAIEDYFTLPKLMENIRDFVILFVYTTRFCSVLTGQNFK